MRADSKPVLCPAEKPAESCRGDRDPDSSRCREVREVCVPGRRAGSAFSKQSMDVSSASPTEAIASAFQVLRKTATVEQEYFTQTLKRVLQYSSKSRKSRSILSFFCSSGQPSLMMCSCAVGYSARRRVRDLLYVAEKPHRR